MTDLPRETLCELMATYGPTLCDDPRRCEALLRDLCGTHRREIHVLISALRERVAADLLAASEGVPREVLRARLTQRLHDNLGLTDEIARWAVDSWALALGKLSPAELSIVSPRNAVPEGTSEANRLSPAEQNAVPPSSDPIASHTAPVGWRRRLGAPVMMVIGLSVAGLVLASIWASRHTAQQASIESDSGMGSPSSPEKARPYPFGRDAAAYLKSLEPSFKEGVDTSQGSTGTFSCFVEQHGPPRLCVRAQGGRVDLILMPDRLGHYFGSITTPSGKAAFVTDLELLGLTEDRDGKHYLRESSYTLDEVVSRLVEAWQELKARRSDGHQYGIFGQYVFEVTSAGIIVIDAERIKSEFCNNPIEEDRELCNRLAAPH